MEEIEKILKALADKKRLQIVALLSLQSYCVCELASLLKITQPSVSKHLKKLKASGFIDSRQDGLWTIYFLSSLQNKKHQKILETIIDCLLGTSQIQKDIQKAKKISRKKLCCK